MRWFFRQWQQGIGGVLADDMGGAPTNPKMRHFDPQCSPPCRGLLRKSSTWRGLVRCAINTDGVELRLAMGASMTTCRPITHRQGVACG